MLPFRGQPAKRTTATRSSNSESGWQSYTKWRGFDQLYTGYFTPFVFSSSLFIIIVKPTERGGDWGSLGSLPFEIKKTCRAKMVRMMICLSSFMTRFRQTRLILNQILTISLR